MAQVRPEPWELWKIPFTTANSSDLLSELRIENSTLEEPVGPNIVEYSYQLKDFHDGYAIPSNHTVHSAVNCSLVEVHSQGQYWRWNNWDRTGPFGIKNLFVTTQ